MNRALPIMAFCLIEIITGTNILFQNKKHSKLFFSSHKWSGGRAAAARRATTTDSANDTTAERARTLRHCDTDTYLPEFILHTR